MEKITLAIVLAILTSSARAQPNPMDEARTHFKNATELYDANNFRGALVEFKRAYELSPSYKILFNIGQVEMELQDYAEALKAYTRYLREGGPDVPPDRVAQLNAEIERVKGRVGYVVVQTGAGAEVLVDEVSVGYAPLPEPVPVNTGPHHVTVRSSGREPINRDVDVAGKQQVTVAIDVPATSTGVQTKPGITRANPTPHTTHPFNSKLVMLGGGILFVGGSTLAIVELTKVPSNCSVSTNHCLGPPNDPSLKKAGDAIRLSNIGWTIGGVGLAALAGGIVWYVTGAKTEQEPKLAATPWLTPDGGGIALSGRL
jgi:hypothetical protein